VSLRACLRKVAYEAQEAAFQKGMDVYLCHHCYKWHRAIPHAVKMRPEFNWQKHKERFAQTFIKRIRRTA
jgi:hypothetical protein